MKAFESAIAPLSKESFLRRMLFLPVTTIKVHDFDGAHHETVLVLLGDEKCTCKLIALAARPINLRQSLRLMARVLHL